MHVIRLYYWPCSLKQPLSHTEMFYICAPLMHVMAMNEKGLTMFIFCDCQRTIYSRSDCAWRMCANLNNKLRGLSFSLTLLARIELWYLSLEEDFSRTSSRDAANYMHHFHLCIYLFECLALYSKLKNVSLKHTTVAIRIVTDNQALPSVGPWPSAGSWRTKWPLLVV